MSAREPDDEAKPPVKSARDARLARALRDNLRRRKAVGDPPRTED